MSGRECLMYDDVLEIFLSINSFWNISSRDISIQLWGDFLWVRIGDFEVSKGFDRSSARYFMSLLPFNRGKGEKQDSSRITDFLGQSRRRNTKNPAHKFQPSRQAASTAASPSISSCRRQMHVTTFVWQWRDQLCLRYEQFSFTVCSAVWQFSVVPRVVDVCCEGWLPGVPVCSFLMNTNSLRKRYHWEIEAFKETGDRC